MTSRPALGMPPNPQNRIAGGTVSRRTAQITSTLNDAKKAGLGIDIAGDGDKQPLSSTAKPAPAVAVSSSQLSSSDSSASRLAAIESQTSSGFQLPFPPRPGQHSSENSFAASRVSGDGMSSLAKREARMRVAEPPLEALLLPQAKPVDYYPWSGNHPEDNFSDPVVKSGFQNKPLVNNETNTARPSIWNHLKHKHALQPLSSLFVNALEKRQTLGRITGPSISKPPPRITLTSTRREAWLQDMSNPAIPLRKLNRTIPFGITGKVLLEQCLDKNIPIQRAVWLSKAVGANELRAYKRKGPTGLTGVSGEFKWIREWTGHVQQFLEGTGNMCGQPGWKDKMQYAISFSYHLFTEQLLDHEAFLEWLLATVEKSSIDHLPLWLVLTQTYWKHLMSTRKRGRRLARCLFAKLESITSEDIDMSDVYEPIIRRLQQLLTTIAVTNKGCMIAPKVWEQYRHLLDLPFQDTNRQALRAAIAIIDKRNDRLVPGTQTKSDSRTSRKRIIAILDHVGFDFDFEELIEKCCRLENDLKIVVSTVLEWASSAYRADSYQVYLAVRILRKFYDLGVDVDAQVLSLLSTTDKAFAFDFTRTFYIATNLANSSHFSVGRFCQSLIVRGATGAAQDGSESDRRLLALLKSLPTEGLPEHVCTLRKLLLKEADIDCSTEMVAFETVKTAILQRLSNPLGKFCSPLATSKLDHFVEARISSWLKEQIHFQNLQSSDSDCAMKEDVSAIHLGQFFVLRDIAEHINDLDLLGDLLGECLSTDDAELLISITETVQYHLESFNAIGILKFLKEKLLKRYQALRMQTHLEKPLVSAMVTLFTTTKSDSALLQQLERDLAQCDQRATLAMCSPASDNAADVLMNEDVDTDGEIDRILSSGTLMDEQIIARVFKRITSRIAKCNDLDPSYRARCSAWLSRLRLFDRSTFDNFMKEWMTQSMAASRHTCLLMLPSLVGFRCLSLSSFIQCANYCRGPAKTDHDFCSQLDLDTLRSILGSTTTPECDAEVPYRYRLECRKFAVSSTAKMLECLQRTIQSCALANDKTIRDDLLSLLTRTQASFFIKRAGVHAPQDLRKCFYDLSTDSSTNVVGFCSEILDLLIDPTGALYLANLPLEKKILQLFNVADELSLAMCQLELQHLVPPGPRPTSPSTEKAFRFLQAHLLTCCRHTKVWSEMLSVLDHTHMNNLCQISERHLLASLRTIAHATSTRTSILEEDLNASMVQNRNIVESLSQIVIGNWSTNFGSCFETMKLLVEALSSSIESSPEPTNTKYIIQSISSLLRLFLLYKHSVPRPRPSNVDIPALLTLLCTLFVLPSLESFSDLKEFLFDVIAYFSDELTDDQRNIFWKTESQRCSNDRYLAFVFGNFPSSDVCLCLVTSASTSAAASSSTPTSTPAASASTPAQRFVQQQQHPGTPRPTPPSSQQQQSSQHSQQPSSRGPTTTATTISRTSLSSLSQQKAFNPPVPFPLKRWEILPHTGGGSGGAGENDTGISLSLFGARKVG